MQQREQDQWESQRQDQWKSQHDDKQALRDPEHLAIRDPEELALRATDGPSGDLTRYEPKGVPIEELKEELKTRDGLSPDRLNEILRRFDANNDEYLTYDEFVTMMTSDNGAINRREKSAMKKFLAAAIQNIVPKSDQKDFLQTYSCCPPPLFMILITITEVIVFSVYAAILADEGRPVTATSGVYLSSPLIYAPRRRYEVWRFVTYMLLHQGYLHLIGNMIVQLLLGLPLELAHKWWRVILIYILGVLAGSMAHSITDTNSRLVGASGGCYALLGGHIASIIINWKEMNYECCSGSIKRILLSAPVRLTACLLYDLFIVSSSQLGEVTSADFQTSQESLIAEVCYLANLVRRVVSSRFVYGIAIAAKEGTLHRGGLPFGRCPCVLESISFRFVEQLIMGANGVCIDTAVAVYRRYFSDNPEKIGIAAHMGGLVAGLVLGVLILRNIHKLSWELILGWIGLAIYLAFIIIVTLFNILYPHYPETDWRPCCPV